MNESFNSKKQGRVFSLCMGVLLPLGLQMISSARADTIVVPNAYTDAVAEYEVAGGAGGRYQQIFSASQFWPASETHSIHSIAWRPGKSLFTGTYTSTIDQFEVYIFTTQKSVSDISTIFAENYANSPDRILVYSGPITFSATLNSYGGQHAFAFIIPFQVPFQYTPANGNLMIEVAGYDNYQNLWEAQVDLVSASDVTSYVWGSHTAVDGAIRGFGGAGIVTAFATDYVPPTAWPQALTLSSPSVTGGKSLT